MKKLFFAIFIFCVFVETEAQINFPHGQNLKLVTSENIIYDETEIPFIYSGGKVIDLKWIMVSDSIPSVWFTQACLNGTCLIYPSKGQFQNFLNNPDSIGYIKYHFDFNHTHGTAYLKYIIYINSVLDNDAKTVTFEITYNGISAGVENILSDKRIEFYPNPASDKIDISAIKNTEKINSVEIVDMLGRNLYSEKYSEKSNKLLINTEFLNTGVYIAKINIGNESFQQKFIISK